MGDLVVCVGAVNGVIENDLVHRTFGAVHYQSFLVSIWHIAGNLLELLGDNSLAVIIDFLGCGNDMVSLAVTFNRTKACAAFLKGFCYIINLVRNRILLDIPESVGVIALVILVLDIQGHGMAFYQREISFLIAGIQIGAALGIKGLGDTCQTGACDWVCDLSIITLNLEVNGVFLQNIGAPLSIDLHILGDRHRVNKALFLVSIHVEPADKGVIAVGRRLNTGIQYRAMRCFPFGKHICIVFHIVLIQIKLNGTGYRNPLGVESKGSIAVIGTRRHCVSRKIELLTGTFRVQIPPLKDNGSGFILVRSRGCIGCPVIAVQRSLVKHTGFCLY